MWRSLDLRSKHVKLFVGEIFSSYSFNALQQNMLDRYLRNCWNIATKQLSYKVIVAIFNYPDYFCLKAVRLVTWIDLNTFVIYVLALAFFPTHKTVSDIIFAAEELR